MSECGISFCENPLEDWAIYKRGELRVCFTCWCELTYGDQFIKGDRK